jgi:hypothetical protein
MSEAAFDEFVAGWVAGNYGKIVTQTFAAKISPKR